MRNLLCFKTIQGICRGVELFEIFEVVFIFVPLHSRNFALLTGLEILDKPVN